MESAIIERVNGHYGYRAVSRIRLSQVGPEIFAAKPKENNVLSPDSVQISALKTTVAPVADEKLRDALERLGRNIATRGDIKGPEK